MSMRTDDFDYNLPEELIAQAPAEPRDSCRLLVVDRKGSQAGTPLEHGGTVEHRIFRDIIDYIEPGDVLVINKTRVMPARLIGRKTGSGGVVETLLLKRREDVDPLGHVWECLVKPGKRLKPGAQIEYRAGGAHAPEGAPVVLTAEVVDFVTDSRGGRLVRFEPAGCNAAGEQRTLDEAIHAAGHVPLPPYITDYEGDPEKYQTVYAKELGSAAAPTAGLHFTPQLMDTIRSRGVNIAEVTLHVGLGTFRPVNEESIEDHQMHSEWYSVSEETAKLINETRAAGHRVIAVGTTSCRTLESVWAKYGKIVPCSGNTSIFIYPGVELKAIDGLITNFHLPESTLIMLIAAFYGYDKTMAAYKVAVEEKYRFFSFGDAMFIR
mgnify:CR=1 FL=1